MHNCSRSCLIGTGNRIGQDLRNKLKRAINNCNIFTNNVSDNDVGYSAGVGSEGYEAKSGGAQINAIN